MDTRTPGVIDLTSPELKNEDPKEYNRRMKQFWNYGLHPITGFIDRNRVLNPSQVDVQVIKHPFQGPETLTA